MGDRIIFHVDVNSAFLSWTAAYRVEVLGQQEDLREVPSVIAGDRESRHSIVLAKSVPAKKYGIETGEPLFQALAKCPDLIVAEPNFDLYTEASRHFIQVLHRFSPTVEQYSIDEAWVDMSGTTRLFGPPVQAANLLRETVKDTLGFTVNVGISTNKLLSKMAGDFEKPDKVHTLFPEEVPKKMWPLPVRNLLSVGKSTEKKLHRLGIRTIGQLAKADRQFLCNRLGKQGETLWCLANGIDADELYTHAPENKGYGNSVTTPQDIVTKTDAQKVLLSLCETVGMRLRKSRKYGQCITVHLRTNEFRNSCHQSILSNATNSTEQIYDAACRVFQESWDGKTPLRQLGVQITRLTDEPYQQFDLFSGISPDQADRRLRLDDTVDSLRERFGDRIILRAKFADGSAHMSGGSFPCRQHSRSR